MTNEETIKHLTRKHLAELLIKVEQRPDYDEGFDGEWHYIGTTLETRHITLHLMARNSGMTMILR